MAVAQGSSVGGVLPVRGRTVAWSRTGPGETGCQHGAHGGDNGGRNRARFGGEKEESRALEVGGSYVRRA
jgi:hypothetical protein